MKAIVSALGRGAKTKTGRQTLMLFGGQILAMAVGIITTPIMTRVLGPDEYGRYISVLAIVTFLATFFDFGFFVSGSRLLAKSDHRDGERRVFAGLLSIAVIEAFIFSAIIYGLSFWVDRWFQGSVGTILRIVAPLAGFVPLQFSVQEITRGSNRIEQQAGLTVFPGLWMLIGVLMLTLKGNLGVLSVTLLNFSGLAAAFLMVILFFKPDFSKLKESLRDIYQETLSYGFPSYIGRVFSSASFSTDRLFLSSFAVQASVGFYSLATLMASPLVLLSQSFADSVFKRMAKQDRISPLVILINLAWLIPAALLLILLGPVLVRLLFSERYLPVVPLLIPLAIAGIFQGLYQPYNHFLGAHGQGRAMRNAGLIVTIANLVLNFSLIKYFGAMGAAVASLGANVTYFVACVWYYKRYVATLAQKPTAHEGTEKFSADFFEKLYENDPEPWNLSSRASQQLRYEDYLALLRAITDSKSTVLDIGCSQGQFTAQIAPFVGAVEAFDVSELAIKRAQEQHAAKNIVYSVGSLPVLSFAKDSFDVVLALEVLYYLNTKERQKALEEIRRTLKKGGHLLISVNIGPEPYFSLESFQELIGSYFSIDTVQPRYGALERWIESNLTMLETTPMKRIAQWAFAQRWIVRTHHFLTKIFWGKKGVTMAYILAHKK
jgi:O-antigen/teichoic acid export membrane protein/SAM-dependent methyltransferase